MSSIFTVPIHTTAEELWNMLTKSYTQKLPHAMKEVVDNSFAAFSKLSDGSMHIRITIEEKSDGYIITISDSATGIPRSDIGECLSIGKAKRTGLNEHGCGLKNMLAFCCPRLDTDYWEIISHPKDKTDTYMIPSPWSESMTLEQVDPSRHPFASGLTIRVCVPDNVMRFYGGSGRGRPNLKTIVQRLKEHFGVTYALHPLMQHSRRLMDFTINGERVIPIRPENFRIVKNITKQITLADGATPIEVTLKHIRIDEPNADSHEFYRRNMNSSGVLLHLHSRLIMRLTPQDLYGLSSNHNDFNPFMAIVNVTGDPKRGVPPTMTTKNGLIESDVLTQGLLDFIRTEIPQSTARDPNIKSRDRSEAEMVREFVNNREAHADDFGTGYSITENKTWPICDGTDRTLPIDIVEILPAKVNLYEAKKFGCSVDDILQLWRNTVMVREIVEFADKPIHSYLLSTVCESDLSPIHKLILTRLREKDPQFNCILKTWDDYRISTAN